MPGCAGHTPQGGSPTGSQSNLSGLDMSRSKIPGGLATHNPGQASIFLSLPLFLPTHGVSCWRPAQVNMWCASCFFSIRSRVPGRSFNGLRD